jgi:hypothetical protein
MTDVPKSPNVHSDLSSIFKTPPSFEDFCNAIKAKPHKKAGGLTGTTYTMVKCWSPAMKQLVYDNIIPSWGTKDIPEWWKWKTLCLKPKNPEHITPDTLRPLVLVEVLRKIWIGLIIQQINNTWA